MQSLKNFITEAKLDDMTEIDRVIHLAFFYSKAENLDEFSPVQSATWLRDLGFSFPNVTRLRDRLRIHSSIVRGLSADHFRLHRKKMLELEHRFAKLSERDETIEHSGAILPASLYKDSRGYIESLSSQINSAYENNIFDGCAVLMRRLMEILLILSFEHHGIASEIKSADGTYVMLEVILSRAKNHTKLKLSRNSREHLDVFRSLGNFSAHKIHYTCKRDDIKKHAIEYRALFEELLYKAGIRV